MIVRIQVRVVTDPVVVSVLGLFRVLRERILLVGHAVPIGVDRTRLLVFFVRVREEDPAETFAGGHLTPVTVHQHILARVADPVHELLAVQVLPELLAEFLPELSALLRPELVDHAHEPLRVTTDAADSAFLEELPELGATIAVAEEGGHNFRTVARPSQPRGPSRKGCRQRGGVAQASTSQRQQEKAHLHCGTDGGLATTASADTHDT
mmetsp:Transcript_36613/g.105326  ORF Transcript_36613/g.105326 Transcript_36613/m.105326 type:complete len:209 (+) Transcript_36613:913-1539(+)